MKVKYKPRPEDEWAEFDPGAELICPRCAHIEPLPVCWVPHSIFPCPVEGCGPTMFDIWSIVGDDTEFIAVGVKLGILDHDNITEWYQKYQLWATMWCVGGPPKWRVAPMRKPSQHAPQ